MMEETLRFDCFLRLVRIMDIMNGIAYKEILENHLLSYADGKISSDWIFQNNNVKRQSKLIKKWLL